MDKSSALFARFGIFALLFIALFSQQAFAELPLPGPPSIGHGENNLVFTCLSECGDGKVHYQWYADGAGQDDWHPGPAEQFACADCPAGTEVMLGTKFIVDGEESGIAYSEALFVDPTMPPPSPSSIGYGDGERGFTCLSECGDEKTHYQWYADGAGQGGWNAGPAGDFACMGCLEGTEVKLGTKISFEGEESAAVYSQTLPVINPIAIPPSPPSIGYGEGDRVFTCISGCSDEQGMAHYQWYVNGAEQSGWNQGAAEQFTCVGCPEGDEVKLGAKTVDGAYESQIAYSSALFVVNPTVLPPSPPSIGYGENDRVFTCLSNCGNATVHYLWHMGGAPQGTWVPGPASQFICTGCQMGTEVKLGAKAIEGAYESAVSYSETLQVSDFVPHIGPANPTRNDVIVCESNCELPSEPEIALQYMWIASGHPSNTWAIAASPPISLDCRVFGCLVNEQVWLAIKRCNSTNGICSTMAVSEGLTLADACNNYSESCPNSQCCAGFYCAPDWTCQPPPGEGQPCTNESGCQPGLECYQQTGSSPATSICTGCISGGGTINPGSNLGCCAGLAYNHYAHSCQIPTQAVLIGGPGTGESGETTMYFIHVTNPEEAASAEMIAATVALLLIAIVYMAGTVLENTRLKSWSKREISELFFTLVAVGVITFLIAAFSEANIGELVRITSKANMPFIYENNYMNYTNLTAYDASALYLEHLAGAGLRNIATIRSNMDAYETRITFQKYKCNGICFIAMNGVTESVHSETLSLAVANSMLGSATVSYLSAVFQFFTLIYIKNGLFLFFLPIAIIIRMIPFMRHFAGALIGIIVALYLLYPTMLIANSMLVPNLAKGFVSNIDVPDRDGLSCLGVDVFTTRSGVSKINCINTDIAKEWDQKVSSWSPWALPEPTNELEAMKLNVLMFIAAVFLPAFNFIVIAALGRDLSRFLGDEADISRLGQMV